MIAPERRGLVISAPHSGSGKTVFTLGLLRALTRRSLPVSSAKSGPDFIDPQFHAAATGSACQTLDAWATDPDSLRAGAYGHAPADGTLVVEGAMGLFDGSANGAGSTADLAAILGLPVVLVIDVSRQAQSVAALIHGFRSYRPDVTISGVVLNRVASPRHERMIARALEAMDATILGALTRDEHLALPSRHLGLVQAVENPDLEAFIARAAEKVEAETDVTAVLDGAAPLPARSAPAARLAPLGQNIAIADDLAFTFLYPHLTETWRCQGAAIQWFSPLADESPPEDCDAVFLPGGYPELHAGRLASATGFRAGMRHAAENGRAIYGECGGYMVLGEALIDADGHSHPMLDLLPLVTSFAEPRRHLGYRALEPLAASPWQVPLAAHEFHYSSAIIEGPGEPLFAARDAEGAVLGPIGLRQGSVFGSYAHVIGPGPATVARAF
ncbi:MAG: cobyrinate a,c-diamide synthase [Pseudomonadota bacterium]